jgi:pimeloyl-ACP methyl ester carboxylesterase
MTTSTSLPVNTVVTDDGLTLGYRELGSGPPVLLLHGWPTSSYLWRNVMPALAEHNRVLAPDLPGFGASDKPADARYDFAFFEAALDGFLAAAGVDDADPVGVACHDISGPIAVHWTLSRPGRVSRLAVLNTLLYPEVADAVVEFIIELSTPGPREQRTSDEGLAEVMRLGVTDPSLITDELMAAVVAPFDTTEARQALARAGIGLSLSGLEEIAAGLGGIDVPVRVVYGEDDLVLPGVSETMTRLAADVPQAEVTAIPRCGHFLQEEAPEQVAGLLAAFFAPDGP